ncbi:MAG: 2Fe-2S iron-sulfur cluster-binding protein [Gemmatimonadaceae bacterium]
MHIPHTSATSPGAALPSPALGDQALDFAVPGAVPARRLADFRGGPVVLTFHPGHWDPARAEYIATYNRLIARAPGLAGAKLLSIAGSGPWQELTFADTALSIPVIAGDTSEVARLYGVGSAPAVFVIDEGGTIRWRHDAATDALPHPDDVSRALAALAEPPDDTGDARVAAADASSTMRDDPLVSFDAPDSPAPPSAWTRRDFVATALGAAFALALTPLAARAEPLARTASAPGAGTAIGAPAPATLRVNGRDIALTLEPRVTLLDALREYAGLTGSKKGCDHGQCGACTVHVNGRRVLSCLTFAVMQQGKEITTIEGLAATAGVTGDALHPMQQAFLTHDGFQCGYCTSGQIMSATAVLREPWGPDDDDVREAMSGNLCRCGAYPGIVAAVQSQRAGQPAPTGGTPRR